MDTSDESPEVLEASGVVLPVATTAFADTVRYLADNNLLAAFEAHLGKIGLTDIWIDIATANALKHFLYDSKKKDAAARNIMRCQCKSWKGPKFPEKEK